jgi:predicted XRE-type DNA-binding protein
MTKAKRAKDEVLEIEAGSGNVFEDLGLPDASGRLAKAELARVIRHIVKDKNWTQHRAADVLAIAPTDVSDLMRGKLARFSQRRLERFLNALSHSVERPATETEQACRSGARQREDGRGSDQRESRLTLKGMSPEF